MFDSPTKAEQQTWMAQWRAAANALTRVRAAELAATDLRGVVAQLDGAFRLSLTVRPPQPWSGLVDQQRAFHRREPRARSA